MSSLHSTTKLVFAVSVFANLHYPYPQYCLHSVFILLITIIIVLIFITVFILYIAISALPMLSSYSKGKGSFYIAQYPVRWNAQSALHVLPSLTDLFIPTPTRLLLEAFCSTLSLL